MQEITIGIMIPTSGILPMGKQFDRAFKEAVNAELSQTDFQVEFITEMIGQGNPAMIEKSLDLLLGYHDVDLVTGLVSNKAMEGFVEKFEKRQLPLIINNLGEHHVPTKGYGNSILINSANLWQHCWVMGQYAAQNLGKRGLIISSIFDAGYLFINCFQLGLFSVDQDFQFDLRLLSPPPSGQLSQVREAFDAINMADYDFVFPLFCGEEATIFLEEFYTRGLVDTTKIIGLPYLLDLKERELEGLELISTVENHQIPEDYVWRDVFKDMGQHCGQAVGKAIVKNNGKITQEELLEEMSKINAEREYRSTHTPHLKGDVKLIKHEVGKENHILSTAITSVSVGQLSDNEQLKQARDAVQSVWMNSYLGV